MQSAGRVEDAGSISRREAVTSVMREARGSAAAAASSRGPVSGHAASRFVPGALTAAAGASNSTETFAPADEEYAELEVVGATGPPEMRDGECCLPGEEEEEEEEEADPCPYCEYGRYRDERHRFRGRQPGSS